MKCYLNCKKVCTLPMKSCIIQALSALTISLRNNRFLKHTIASKSMALHAATIFWNDLTFISILFTPYSLLYQLPHSSRSQRDVVKIFHALAWKIFLRYASTLAGTARNVKNCATRIVAACNAKDFGASAWEIINEKKMLSKIINKKLRGARVLETPWIKFTRPPHIHFSFWGMC